MKKFLSSIMICVMSITSTGAISCFAAENPQESKTVCTTQVNINSEKEIKDLVAESVTKPEDTTNKKEIVKTKPSKLKSYVMLVGKIILKVYSLYEIASFFYKKGNKSGYDKGNNDGFNIGYDKGYDKGNNAGLLLGLLYGYENGSKEGYEKGLSHGNKYYDGLFAGMMDCVGGNVD